MNVTKNESFETTVSHIKTLLKNMACPACGKIIKIPQIGVCGHTSCFSCWRPLKICRLCGVNSTDRLTVNTALSSRTRAILRLVERFKSFNNLCERSSLIHSRKSSSDEILSKKNQQKEATVPPKSYSVSQETTPLFLSWNDSNSTENLDELNISDEEFLSISQVNRNPKFYVGPVRIDFSRYRNPINYENSKNSKKRSLSPPIVKSHLSKSAKKKSHVNIDEMEVVNLEYVDGTEKIKSQLKDNKSKSIKASIPHPFNKIAKDMQATLGGSKFDTLDKSSYIPIELLDVSDDVRNENLQDSVAKNKRVVEKKCDNKKFDSTVKNYTENENSEGVNCLTKLNIISCRVTDSFDDVSSEIKASGTFPALSALDKDRHALRQVLNASRQYNRGLAIMKNTIDLNYVMAETENTKVIDKNQHVCALHHSEPKYTTEINKKTLKNDSAPFLYSSNLKDKQSVSKIRKIPFYYKSSCISKDWCIVPVDDVNIEMYQDNSDTPKRVDNTDSAKTVMQSLTHFDDLFETESPVKSLNGSVENFQTILVNDALHRRPDPDSSQTYIYPSEISYSYGDLTSKSESDILLPPLRESVAVEGQENQLFSKPVGSKTKLSNQNILSDNMFCYNDITIQFVSQIQQTENREENVTPNSESMNNEDVRINVNKDSRIQDFDTVGWSKLMNRSVEIDDSIICGNVFRDTESPTQMNVRLNQNGTKPFQNLSNPCSIDFADFSEIRACTAITQILKQSAFELPENVSSRKHFQSNDIFTSMNKHTSLCANKPLNSADLNKDFNKILQDKTPITYQKEIVDSGTPISGNNIKRHRGSSTYVVNAFQSNLRKSTNESIKYVRALAAGNWILSLKWVLKCKRTNFHVPEEPYEVLDSGGSIGPYLSRTERGTLFRGFNFFCFPPFSMLDVGILSEILTNAGGNVVEYIEDIKIKDPSKICLLLGEMDCIQKDMLARVCRLNPVVAVNIQWALDCLGKGSIISLKNWLLSLESLLPVVDWPLELFHDADDIEVPSSVINSS